MTHPHEIAFVDPAVTDFDTLLSGLRPDVEAIVLSGVEPAVAQMTRILEGRTNLDAIHVMAHGRPGEVSFAAGAFSIETIQGEATGLHRFGAALGAEGVLSIWACQVGAGERGAAFTKVLAERTGARVATAGGLVGAAAQGGTWVLDRGAGHPPLTAEGMAAYADVMATFTGTSNNDVANATTGTLTGFSGGTVAQLQDSTGDTFNGGSGADTIVAGSGDDTINIANGQFVAGESTNGGANTASGVRDQIALTNATTVDFSAGGVSGVETLTGSSGNDTVTMTATQRAGFSTINLGSGTSDILNVVASGNISALATPTLSGIETGNLTGTSGNNTVTLSGAQLNAILVGAGTINLGAGSGDTINLTSTSADLNTLGATNTSIAGVEAISASGATTGVTITLSGQTEAFAVTGSGHADFITGGSGADRIIGGTGADTLSGGAGNDTITYDGSDISIVGGSGFDSLVVNGAATINLSLADQTSGDTANVTGFENVNASGSSAAVSLVGSSGGNVLTGGSANDTLTGGAGNDTINGGAGTGDKVVFSGARANYTISLAGATYKAIDNRGGSPDGTDTVTNVENFQFSDGTLTASQLNATNPIVLENQKLGNPESEWGIDGAGSSNIEGFATDISINRGQIVNFKINTGSSNYRIDIYRLGYYGGMGARKVDTIQHTGVQNQPTPLRDSSTGLVDAGNWSVSASWAIPADAASGIYIAKLVRQDGTFGENQIPFIVRDDSSHSDVIFQTSDETWQAYNGWGGANLYGGNGPGGDSAPGRAYAVSYNRPITTRGGGPAAGPQDYIFGVEFPAIQWLEKNGYDVSYMTGMDSDRLGSLIQNHKMFLSVGHDEYWSGQQRANVEAARDAGVNLSFWSGNEVYWETRFAPSISAGAQPYRTLVTYKETRAGPIDPSNQWTGTYRDPRFVSPTAVGGGRPENALSGTMFQVDAFRSDAITIPYDDANLRFWRNTSVANLQPGQTAALTQNYLGYEWDESPDNGFRPAGLIELSSTTLPVTRYLLDYGTVTGSATATHNLTLYRAPSGALVFGAGTVYWAWGLDANHDLEVTPVDPRVKQAMVNLLADMGVQPGTLEAGLLPATQSTDATKPVSSITAPNNRTALKVGDAVTISGTASDVGGVIAAVEVSTDGGTTWHRAVGDETWTYSWVASTPGTITIKTRAVDDSVNLETPGAGRTVTVTGSNFFSASTVPPIVPDADATPIEVGMKFQSSVAGTVTGVRYYKSDLNIGPHTGSLWSSTGTRLATVTFTNESGVGWQTASFSSPVAITAGTTYVVSYHTNYGHYTATGNYFAAPVTNGPLTAPTNAGVYTYNSASVFPNSTFNAANYWVDVLFNPSVPAVNQPPVANADSGFTTTTNTAVTIAASALLANDTDANGDALTITTLSAAQHGIATLNGQTITFTPTASYTGNAGFTYTVDDGHGGTATATVSLTVTAPATGVSLFTSTDTPNSVADSDPSPVELGMKFIASASGTITAIRYYKSATDTGTHTGALWTSTGTLLATGTFTNETASGWQTLTLPSPVAISAGTTYVAGYHSNGHYIANSNYFTTAKTNGPLTAPATGNGVYSYGASNVFPTSTFGAANYWVDVLYNQGSSTMTVADSQATTQNTTRTSQASTLLANDSDPDAHRTNQFHSATGDAFATDFSSNNLRALSDALSSGDGVNARGLNGLPTDGYDKRNYHVDVSFRPQLAA